jgi:hypothetical protein
MLYFRSLKIVQHDIIIVHTCYMYVVHLVSSVWHYSTWLVPVFLFEYCIITLNIRFFNLSFDVLFVICKLHNLRSPVKIPFYLVPPIVFSSRAHALFYLGTIRRISWNSTTVSQWKFHDNRRMNTSADVSKFKILPFHV